MKQAIIITAYKHFARLKDLINQFDDRFNIYIHVDKKSVDSHNELPAIDVLPQVKRLSRKYTVNWGGVNHLYAYLDLISYALKDSTNQFFHIITGEDWPLVSIDEIYARFQQNPEINYLSYFKLPDNRWKDGGLSRIQYYHFYNEINTRKHRIIVPLLSKIQQKLLLKRSLPKAFNTYYGGSKNWSLSRAAVQYVITFGNDNPDFFRRTRYTNCVEEMYFQTILVNSPLSNTIINDNLRYIIWENRNGSSPAYLDETDFDPIQSGDFIFGRKFHTDISKELMQLLNQKNNEN